MSRSRSTPRDRDHAPTHASDMPFEERPYGWVSQRPLHVLLFLAPLIAMYEVGSAMYLYNAEQRVTETIRAHHQLSTIFETFGASGVFLPGAALVAILFVWHLLTKDSWRIRGGALGVMLVESALWAIPMLALWQVVASASTELVRAMAAAAVHPAADLAGAEAGVRPASEALRALPLGARLTISIGAGLYEELLFRLVGITLLHFVLVDLLGIRNVIGTGIAILGAALAFAAYHGSGIPFVQSGADTTAFLFYTLAGAYLGVLFVLRGFGIVVAAHAVYDIIVLALLGGG